MHEPYSVDDINFKADKLLQAARHGDEASFDKLWEMYRDYLESRVNLWFDQLPEGHIITREIVHETYKRAWNKLDTLKHDNFDNWIFRIQKNLCIDEYRKMKREEKRKEKTADNPLRYIAAESEYEKREREAQEEAREKAHNALSQAYDECLDTISAQRKEVLELRRQGRKYREIADDLGILLGTVKSRISRGKEDIRDCVDENFPDVADETKQYN